SCATPTNAPSGVSSITSGLADRSPASARSGRALARARAEAPAGACPELSRRMRNPCQGLQPRGGIERLEPLAWVGTTARAVAPARKLMNECATVRLVLLASLAQPDPAH